MGRRYAITGATSDFDGYALMGLTGTAAVRSKIYDIVISSRTTPGNRACNYDFQRYTAEPVTGPTAVTPVALDPSYPASTSSGWYNSYPDIPTLTTDAILLNASIPQRVTFRWVSKIKASLIIPAVANNGIAIMFNSSVGGVYQSRGTITFED